jgi:hypothetical protein
LSNTLKKTVIASAVAAAAASFDLSNFDVIAGANAGFTFTLANPKTKKPLDVTITVLGTDSAKYQELQTEQNRRRTEKIANKGRQDGTITMDEFRADGIELLAVCTTGWENMVFNGEPVEFSVDAAIELYTRFPWLAEQVDAAVSERANFMKG